MAALSSRLQRQLAGATAQAQRRWRTPGLSVGVTVDGELAWSHHVGSARLDPTAPLGDDTQVMVGSITKTFTAVLVMQCRDQGLLGLDDRLGRWLPESAHAGLTLRQLLSHTSGLQREPVGRTWETLDAPDIARLVAEVEAAERVLPPHLAFHYSNLAFALLGLVLERVTGRPWEDLLREQLLEPLGLTRTALRPEPDHAHGYLVHPFAGTATPEPAFETRALAPMGGLWSTVADMSRYAAFLADPEPVLRRTTVDEMAAPVVMRDLDSWTGGYGLGLELVRRGDRVFVGHRGAMPGFLSGLRVHRAERTAVFAVATSSAGAEPGPLASQLLDDVLDDAPRPVAAWVPERPRPDLQELLGSWWSEGEELILEIRDGRLWMRVATGAALDDTRFERESADRFRAVQGRERGEWLELVRDGEGALTRMYFATYAVTREPLAFSDLSSGSRPV